MPPNTPMPGVPIVTQEVCNQHSGVCVKMEQNDRSVRRLHRVVAAMKAEVTVGAKESAVAAVRVKDHEDRIDALEQDREQRRKATVSLAIKLALAGVAGGGTASVAGHYVLRAFGGL